MKRKLFSDKRQLLRLVGTIITLVLLFILLSQQGWDQIGMAILRIPIWRFGVAFTLMILSRLAVTARWFILLKSSRMKVSAIDTIRLTFSGLFASNFLPTTIGGDVVRLAGALQLKLDGTLCTASLVVDRLVGMVGMVAVLPFGLSRLMNLFITQAIRVPLWQWGLAAFGYEWLSKPVAKVISFLNHLIEALSVWIKNPLSLFWALLATWVHMLCLFSAIEVLLGGLDEHMSFWLIAGLWSAVYFLTLIPISINGYGVQELSLGVIFAHAGGISSQSSLLLAILIRTLTMLASLPGAVFIPGILALRRSTVKIYEMENNQN
jgi:uncharacterized membrane protein YbhN (UPF0104 family)